MEGRAKKKAAKRKDSNRPKVCLLLHLDKRVGGILCFFPKQFDGVADSPMSSSSVSTFNGIFIQIEIPTSHTHIVTVQEENHLHKTSNAGGSITMA